MQRIMRWIEPREALPETRQSFSNAALLAMIPMILVFLLAQKHIMDGMVQGAIK